MSIPKVRDEVSGTSRKSGRQAVGDNVAAGERIKSALGHREVSWLVRETGFGDSTIRDAMRRGPARADVAVAIATALGVSTDWLLKGSQRTGVGLADVNDADWIDLPEYDLRELSDESRGPVISTTPFRKDWLNRTLGQASGVWLTRLPADFPRLDLRVGDLVFVKDVPEGEALDGAIYIVRVWGHLTVVRLDSLHSDRATSADGSMEERRLSFSNIGRDDGKAILVARVLGIPVKRV